MEWALGEYVEVNGNLAIIIRIEKDTERIVYILENVPVNVPPDIAGIETVPISKLRKPESPSSQLIMFEVSAILHHLTPEECAAQKRMRGLL